MTRLRELQYSWERQKPHQVDAVQTTVNRGRTYIVDLKQFDRDLQTGRLPTPLKVEFEALYYVTPGETHVWYNVICEGHIIDIIWRE